MLTTIIIISLIRSYRNGDMKGKNSTKRVIKKKWEAFNVNVKMKRIKGRRGNKVYFTIKSRR